MNAIRKVGNLDVVKVGLEDLSTVQKIPFDSIEVGEALVMEGYTRGRAASAVTRHNGMQATKKFKTIQQAGTHKWPLIVRVK